MKTRRSMQLGKFELTYRARFLLLIAGILLIGLSLALLAASLLPDGGTLRLQVTLAPTLFAP
jgi:hypothetical protein